MALQTHPDTGIIYDDANPQAAGVDRFVYVEAYDLATFDINDPATYRVLNFNAYWGRNDGAPIGGLNPRFMYFKRLEKETVAIDHRYTKSTAKEMLVSPAPPSGHPVGTYQEIESAALLDVDELKAQVDTAFQNEILSRFPAVADPAVLISAGGALARKADGATLAPDQAEAVETMKGLEDVVRQLATKRSEFYAAIDAGQDYDLEDWSISE